MSTTTAPSQDTKDTEDVSNLSLVESIALFLPTIIVSVLELQDRTKPSVRRHRYSRHHFMSLAFSAWLFASVLASFFLPNDQSDEVLFLIPVMLVNYALLGSCDMLISPFLPNDDLQEKPHISLGKTTTGTAMPGLSGWNMNYMGSTPLRILFPCLLMFLLLAMNSALVYLLFHDGAFVPLVGLIVGSILTVTATHPTAGQKVYPIRDSPEGLLIHSLSTGEKTRAFLISLKEKNDHKQPVVKLFMFQDARNEYSQFTYWDQRKEENEVDRMARLMPYSRYKDPLQDDHEGLVATARSLTSYLKDRYGSNEWSGTQLNGMLRKHLLSGDVLRAVRRATTGVETYEDDLTWIASDGADLYAIYVLMHVHAIVEQKVNVALDMSHDEKNALPFFIAAMHPKYYGSNSSTWEYQNVYSGSPDEWKLSDSRVQAPNCVRELGIIGTTPERMFKTKDETETRHMIEAYEKMASQVDSCWVRLYACCLYLIRQGRIHALRRWKGPITQDLLRKIEDPAEMNKQLRSLLLTQLGYSTVIAVKTWLPGRLAG